MVRRNIFFYEIRPTRQRDSDWRLNIRDLVTALSALTDNDRVRRVQSITGESYEFVQVVNNGPQPAIAFVRCREHGLPMLARLVSLEPFEIEGDGQLAELTHAVFFDNHIIGAEYNNYGPGLTALADYFRAKVPEILPPNDRVKIAALVNDDQLNLLRRAKLVKSIDVKMGPQLLRTGGGVSSGSSVRTFLRQASSGYKAEHFGISMRNRKGLDMSEVLGLIDWALGQGGNSLNAASATVELEDGTTQPLNLLRTRVGIAREMELINDKARSIAHESAHAQIVAAFDVVEDQIRAASSLRTYGPKEDDS